MKADDESGQASILKTVLVIVVILFIAADFARPLIGRAQLDDKAHKVAEASAEVYKQTKSSPDAKDKALATARAKADELDILLVPDSWNVDDQGTVTVTVERTMEPWLLGKLIRSYYTFRATASERFTA